MDKLINILAIAFILLFTRASTSSSIVLKENGYSNILVSISNEIDQPSDGGATFLTELMDLLNESSDILYKATNDSVYFSEIYLLLPPKWKLSTVVKTREYFPNNADIRLLLSDPVSSTLPYTLHSGKCGIAGGFINIPIDYLTNSVESNTVKAKSIVQQWAQFRYGVFEELGFSGDDLLPYFYRHPEGYDAVTSSNDTVIEGNLISLSGADCEIDENGVISNEEKCRFVPNATDQSAVTSLMSFYWLDSVVGFSNEFNHDRRPPHRQNRLCSSRSSSEIIFESPDLIKTTPRPGLNTTPRFVFVQNTMLPVLYLAIDKSRPSSQDNAGSQGLNILKGSLRRLFSTLKAYPEMYVAWSTFENVDFEVGHYLIEEVAPIRLADGQNIFDEMINNFTFSSNVFTRDVSAVVRDAELRLRKYKDTGGSILYVITSTEAITNDTVTEIELAEKLLVHNIKLMAAESGPGAQGLSRFSILSQGSYRFGLKWGSTAFFAPLRDEIDSLCKNGLKNERRMITSKKSLISADNPWEGSFSIDHTIGTNTTIVLVSPLNGSFAISMISPNGEIIYLENEVGDTNWDYPNSGIGVTWLRLTDNVVGLWNYTIIYDTTWCPECETQPEIHLQIGSSISNGTSGLQTFHSWVSLTAGSEFVDLSQHPVIIQARFESVNGRLGGLAVTADVFLDETAVASISLTDTGTMDSDISNDGIYSGVFHPKADGTYTISFHARQVHLGGSRPNNKLKQSDENPICCGSFLPTVILEHFQSSIHEAITFEVQSSSNALPELPSPVSDLQANTYGVDEDQVYVALTWTVPINTISQVVRYSEDYNQLLDDFQNAPEATIVSGSLENTEAGSSVFLNVSTPYNQGINVYFVVETTGKDNWKVRSHVVWAEPNPPEKVSTQPMSSTTSDPTSSTTDDSTDSTTDSSTITDPTTDSSTITDPTTDSSMITDSTTDAFTITDPTTDAFTITDPTTDSSTITDPTTDGSTITDSVTTTITSSTTDNIKTDSTTFTDTTTTALAPTTESPDPGGLTPAEIGFIVGGIIIFVVLIIAIIILYKRRRSARNMVKVDSVYSSDAMLYHEAKKLRASRKPAPSNIDLSTATLPVVSIRKDEINSPQLVEPSLVPSFPGVDQVEDSSPNPFLENETKDPSQSNSLAPSSPMTESNTTDNWNSAPTVETHQS